MINCRAPPERSNNRGVSTYLDLLRIVAAVEVFLSHFANPKLGGVLPSLGAYGHQSVIVFFAISGYVIAYVSAEHETDLTSYAISRATRIYSVVIPALIITPLPFFFGEAATRPPLSVLNAVEVHSIFLEFATDWWFFNEDAFSNVPYWSLCYKVLTRTLCGV